MDSVQVAGALLGMLSSEGGPEVQAAILAAGTAPARASLLTHQHPAARA